MRRIGVSVVLVIVCVAQALVAQQPATNGPWKVMFVFDDLLEIDDRGMQELLRQIPADKLLIALKGADDTFKTKVFKNMSQRAAEMLKGDLEAKGPVRLADVEAAQKEILLAARKLADEGTIQLGGKGEQYV